jgi:(1->4)-alpha-D-glucan 1-alpha-D-glucosylmutase
VDFERRERALGEVDALLSEGPERRLSMVRDCLDRWEDGRIKLLLTTAGLRLRRDLPELFLSGEYAPLETEVTVTGGVIAFARIHEGDAAIFIAPRLCASLVDADHPVPLGGECWKTSRIMLPASLSGRLFRHEMTGAEIRPTVAGEESWIFAGQAFEAVPVGLFRAV